MSATTTAHQSSVSDRFPVIVSPVSPRLVRPRPVRTSARLNPSSTAPQSQPRVPRPCTRSSSSSSPKPTQSCSSPPLDRPPRPPPAISIDDLEHGQSKHHQHALRQTGPNHALTRSPNQPHRPTLSAEDPPPDLALPSLLDHPVLSFPESTLTPPIWFQFHQPISSHHQPPPHPGPVSRHLIGQPFAHPSYSPRSPPHPDPHHAHHHHHHHHHHRHVQNSPRQHPPVPITTPGVAYQPPKITIRTSEPVQSKLKRPLSFISPDLHFEKTKKIKRFHHTFRSIDLFYPQGHWLRPRTPLGYQIDSPDLPNYPSPAVAVDHQPIWLVHRAAAHGKMSRLCPSESDYTGTGQGWVHPNQALVHLDCSLSPPSSATSLANAFDLHLGFRQRQSALSPGGTGGATHVAAFQAERLPAVYQSQAAPLKAQLIAILRLRSNSGPGEASLRFKKWVLWNAWMRKEQARLRATNEQTLQHDALPVNTCRVAVRENTKHEAKNQAAKGHDSELWTGNEVFDDNGEMIVVESEREESEDEWSDEEDEEEAVEDPVTPIARKVIIRLRIPNKDEGQLLARTALELTPPPSPDSPRHKILESRIEPLESDCQRLSRASENRHESTPPTPPPSPP